MGKRRGDYLGGSTIIRAKSTGRRPELTSVSVPYTPEEEAQNKVMLEQMSARTGLVTKEQMARFKRPRKK